MLYSGGKNIANGVALTRQLVLTSHMSENETFTVGDRVAYHDHTMPIHSDQIRRGTVTKVGRKFITIDIDTAIIGGSRRSGFGNSTTTQKVFPDRLFHI